ncbi:metal-sensitive transcriptional regulator [Candidatus Acetothermia bacterium]|nr:metal-sensitive transcriptional regulator [Candidatus Acetothermia bacterium]MBI3659887.1 metal-sensitive transcriptional regulator [Candidatus Acetothermia bacterium]
MPTSSTIREAKRTHKKGSLAHLPALKRDTMHLVRTSQGQLQAIERMIHDERYCIDVLKQIAAAQATLSQVAQQIIKGHLKSCMTEAIAKGKSEEKIEELAEVLKYLKNY